MRDPRTIGPGIIAGLFLATLAMPLAGVLALLIRWPL